MKFEELQEMTRKKGFGYSSTYVNGTPVYLSRGIRQACYENEESQQALITAISLFQNQDFGNSADYGKESRPGHEYGRYDLLSFEETDADTAVWIHRTEDAIKVYFRFER